MRSSTSSPGRVPPPRRRPRRSGRWASTHGRMAARCACVWVCTRASRPSRTRATTASAFTAPTSLDNLVSQLRKLLGPDLVVTKPPGYLIRIGPSQLDVNRVQALLDEAKTAPAAERGAKLRDALVLWRGPPLEEFAYEAFAQGEIARLEELRLTLLEERLDADIEAGAASELVGELEALVGEHPLRERFREQLMLALYRSGRQAEALEVFQQGRKALVDELGIDPSPRLQQVQAAILRHEINLEPARAAPV